MVYEEDSEKEKGTEPENGSETEISLRVEDEDDSNTGSMPEDTASNQQQPDSAEEKDQMPAEGKDLYSEIKKLKDQIRELSGEFETKLKYDEHKNKIIDGLHRELQEYREGLIQKHFHSMITDAIKIIDDIRKLKAHYEDEPPTENTLPSLLSFLEDIASDIEELFSWQGVSPFRCGAEHFDNTCQRVVKKIETKDPEEDKKVAGSIRPGYEWDGKVLRPEMVAVYVYNNTLTE